MPLFRRWLKFDRHLEEEAFETVAEETLDSLGLSKNPDHVLSKAINHESIEPDGEVAAMFEEVKAGFSALWNKRIDA